MPCPPLFCRIGPWLRRLAHPGALLLAWCFLLPGAALAQDHITQRAWLEDPQGGLTLAQAQQQTLQPFHGLLSRGYGTSVFWLRLHIDPAAHPTPRRDPERLLLRMRPVYLDDIQVFDPLAPQGQGGVIGDHHHPRNSEFDSLDFVVPIARGQAPRDIWLRLSSTSTRQLDVQALNADDFASITRKQELITAGYIGLVTILAIWGVVYWLFSREYVIGAFGLQQINALMFALASLGYLRVLWPRDWPPLLLDRFTSFFSITAVSTAVLFHILLTREFSLPRWILRLYGAMLALWPLKILMVVTGHTIGALQLNMVELLLSPMVFLLAVLLARGWSDDAPTRTVLSRPVVVAFYAAFGAYLLLAGLPGLGLIGEGEIALHVAQAHGLMTGFFVLVMLQYRAHMIHKQQHETTLALERSQLQVQQEREIRNEQEKLLAMLAHELKTPLATMHMRLDTSAQGSQEIKQAIRDMNGVIERCQQTLQLSDSQLAPRVETLDMVSIVRDAVSACGQPHRVHLDLPTRLTLNSDRQLCFIVLNNLLENACKYAPPDAPIELRLSTAWDMDQVQIVQLEIANPPGKAGWPDPDNVFNKYYRSPHARRQAGTGLGLYLVRNLVQVMGGRIDYAPTPQAVRFVLQLPLVALPEIA